MNLTIEHIIAISAIFRILSIFIDQSTLFGDRSRDVFGIYREWRLIRRERMKSLCWLFIVYYLLYNGYIS